MNNKTGWIDPKLIKLHTKFEKAYSIKKETFEKIKLNMIENGFDETQEIVIWKETGFLVDGHTRRQAAIAAYLPRVKYIEKSFKNEDQVIKYIRHLQRNRRNLTLQDDIRDIINSSWSEAKNKKKYIAEIIGCSERQAAKYMKIVKDERLVKKILEADQNDKIKLSELTEKKKTKNPAVEALKKAKNAMEKIKLSKKDINEIDLIIKEIRKEMRKL
jgi:ParB-like chromosome segregation protein Spo0J